MQSKYLVPFIRWFEQNNPNVKYKLKYEKSGAYIQKSDGTIVTYIEYHATSIGELFNEDSIRHG